MKYPLTLSLCFFLVACGLSRAQGPATNYTIQQIPNYEGPQAFAINDRGQILISTQQGGYRHNDIYSLGINTLVNIPIPTSSNGLAEGFNNLDDVVFRGETDGQMVVTSGIDGAATTITIDSTGYSQVTPYGINDAGAIVAVVTHSQVPYSEYSILYQNGTVTQIGFPGGAPNFTYVSAINDVGAIVGNYEDLQGNFHGMLYENGTYRSINVPHTRSTTINGINNLGAMVGTYIGLLGVERSWVYSNGRFFTLPQLAPGSLAPALSINDEGQILGPGLIWNPNTFAGF